MESIEYAMAMVGVLIIIGMILIFKYPVYALQKRFKKFDISITDTEAKKLTSFYEFTDDFLVQVKELMQENEHVSFTALADYHRGIGNFDQLNKALETVKSSGKKIPFNSIIMLLMTNKDIEKALGLVGKTYHVAIKGHQEEGITIDYEVEFKIEHEQSLWLENNLDLITRTIKSSMSLCVVSAEEKEAKIIEKALLENYLNEDFWMTNASAIIISQELKVR